MSELEMCCECDQPTGMAGYSEDSFYTAGRMGPYCETCWDELPDKLQAELDTANKRVKELEKYLSIVELEEIDITLNKLKE